MWFSDPAAGRKRRDRATRAASKVTGRVGRRVPTRRASTAEPIALGDADSLSTVVDRARDGGFTTDMTVTDQARVRCGGCGVESRPEDLTRLWLQRLEGASDPADTSTVSALRCPACGAHGLLITPYGPEADSNQADVQVGLPAPLSADMSPYRSGTFTETHR
jgi:hypothetical protein